MAKGTPRAQLYAKITENGATAQKFIDGPTAPSAAPAEPDADKVYAIPAAADAPVKGRARRPRS